MKTDPLIKAAKKVYRESQTGKLDVLLAEERRWKSKETMASNKLRAVRERITEVAKELAESVDLTEAKRREAQAASH